MVGTACIALSLGLALPAGGQALASLRPPLASRAFPVGEETAAALITGRLCFYHSCGTGGTAFIRVSLPLLHIYSLRVKTCIFATCAIKT